MALRRDDPEVGKQSGHLGAREFEKVEDGKSSGTVGSRRFCSYGDGSGRARFLATSGKACLGCQFC